jgi:hypothetical protein
MILNKKEGLFARGFKGYLRPKKPKSTFLRGLEKGLFEPFEYRFYSVGIRKRNAARFSRCISLISP